MARSHAKFLSPSALGVSVMVLAFSAGVARAQQASPVAGSSSTQNIETVESGWQTICRPIQPARTSMSCSVLYESVTARDRVRLASIEILRDEKGYKLGVSTPLGMNLKSGVDLQLDGAKFAHLEYESCMGNGCLAETAVSDQMFAQLKSGKTLNLSFSNGVQKAQMKVMLTGFEQAVLKMTAH